MLSINIPQCYLVTKNYDVKITKFKGTIYSNDTEWIAEWFYTQYQPYTDNVTFHIRGDFHTTYPNPPHLSVEIEYPDKTLSGWLHLSMDEYGKGYVQNLDIAGNKKKSIKINKNKKAKRHQRTKNKKAKRHQRTKNKK